MEIINQTGLFFFPLLLCSILATYISIERYFSLRKSVIFPNGFLDEVLSGSLNSLNYTKVSLVGSLLGFFHSNRHAKDCPPDETTELKVITEVMDLCRNNLFNIYV